MPEIVNYPRKTKFNANDVLLTDGSEGTKIITIENAVNDISLRAADSSLSMTGKLAPAKEVGRRLAELNTIATAAQKEAKEWAEVAEEAANRTYKRYIARWDKVNAQMVRQGDAEGITTDTSNFGHFGAVNPNYSNPFDTIYPWSERRLCNIDLTAYMALDTGDDITDCVVAWEGDTTFSYDHEYGVWVYTPEFWGDGWDDGTYRYFEVDDREVKGKHHFPAHIGGRWHGREVTLSIEGTDKTCLIPSPGMPAKRIAMSTLHTYANNYGATLDNIWSMDASSLLYLVEYAHFNTQTKLGSGVSSLHDEGEKKVGADAADSAVIRIPANMAANAIVGAILDIGTAKGGNQVGSFSIEAVEPVAGDDTLLAVTLNEAVTVTTANYVSIHGKINTADEAIGGRSGYIGTNGKSSAYYRGEQFFGNLWRYVLGAYHQANTHHVFIAEDEDGADAVNAINVNVHKDTGVVLAGSNGYTKTLGMFRADGLFALPATTEIGGSSSAPTGDYHYAGTTSNTVLLVGGNASSGTNDGRFCGRWNIAASYSAWSYGACPLLKNPPEGV